MTISMTPLAEIVQALPFDLAAEVQDYIEFLLEKRRHGQSANSVATLASAWPPGFFEQTAGVLADDPTFVRPAQGTFEGRESFI